jgi:ABC-type proline/glycine betaine transport system permease subunit
MTLLIAMYGIVALFGAFALGTEAERGNVAEAILILLWCALWPVALAFGLGVLMASFGKHPPRTAHHTEGGG